MRQQMDRICAEVGVWPHAVLRATRIPTSASRGIAPDGTEIPYIICGNGGHNVQKLQAA